MRRVLRHGHVWATQSAGGLLTSRCACGAIRLDASAEALAGRAVLDRQLVSSE